MPFSAWDDEEEDETGFHRRTFITREKVKNPDIEGDAIRSSSLSAERFTSAVVDDDSIV